MGFTAAALQGGYTAWLGTYSTEPKGTEHDHAMQDEQPGDVVVEERT